MNDIFFIFFMVVCNLTPYYPTSRVQDRLEIIVNTWIQFGYVPSPAEVSKEEGIDVLWTKGEASHLNFSIVVFVLL